MKREDERRKMSCEKRNQETRGTEVEDSRQSRQEMRTWKSAEGRAGTLKVTGSQRRMFSKVTGS